MKIHIEPEELEIDPRKNILYVTSNDDHMLSLIDLINSSKTYDILMDKLPGMAIINEKLYVPSSAAEFIEIIDPINNNIHYIKLDSKIMNIAFNNITGSMYTVDWPRESANGYKIDESSSTGALINSIELDNKSYTDIEINNNNGILYVTNSGNNTVSVINCTDNSLMKTIEVDEPARHLYYDTMNNLLHVGIKNTVSVIDGITNEVIANNIILGTHITRIAGEHNGQIYSINSGYYYVSIMNKIVSK